MYNQVSMRKDCLKVNTVCKINCVEATEIDKEDSFREIKLCVLYVRKASTFIYSSISMELLKLNVFFIHEKKHLMQFFLLFLFFFLMDLAVVQKNRIKCITFFPW